MIFELDLPKLNKNRLEIIMFIIDNTYNTSFDFATTEKFINCHFRIRFSIC